MTPADLRQHCAQILQDNQNRIPQLSAFVGLDGFIDEIIHVVDKRENAQSYTRLATIAQFAERLAEAAGKSTNIELVPQLTKLGGNGPIMANALAQFGIQTAYLGNLGYPVLHPVFISLAEKAEVFSISEPCHTDALEFLDGKLMLGKSVQLNDLTWPNIQARFGRERFAAKFEQSDLVAFVNWTMIPAMSELWEALLTELCPGLKTSRRLLFFDLADPEKRSSQDIARALELIVQFQKYFQVALGLNAKEADEISEVLGIAVKKHTPEHLSALCLELNQKLPVQTICIHPVTYALAASQGQISLVEGPYVPRPVITTGGGDHFNAGFCLGQLLGLDNYSCLLLGVSSSGCYVRTGRSPHISDLVHLLQNWPAP